MKKVYILTLNWTILLFYSIHRSSSLGDQYSPKNGHLKEDFIVNYASKIRYDYCFCVYKSSFLNNVRVKYTS